MVDILHKVGIQASPADTYRALATVAGLSRWWTLATTGNTEVGGIIAFRFGGNGGFDMKVLESKPNVRVLWEVVEGPSEWLGTKISFDLKEEDDYTTVTFKHADWRAPVDFMHHCSTKWGVFLMSLKAYLEVGEGAPYPHDYKIDKWEVEALAA